MKVEISGGWKSLEHIMDVVVTSLAQSKIPVIVSCYLALVYYETKFMLIKANG